MMTLQYKKMSGIGINSAIPSIKELLKNIEDTGFHKDVLTYIQSHLSCRDKRPGFESLGYLRELVVKSGYKFQISEMMLLNLIVHPVLPLLESDIRSKEDNYYGKRIVESAQDFSLYDTDIDTLLYKLARKYGEKIVKQEQIFNLFVQEFGKLGNYKSVISLDPKKLFNYLMNEHSVLQSKGYKVDFIQNYLSYTLESLNCSLDLYFDESEETVSIDKVLIDFLKYGLEHAFVLDDDFKEQLGNCVLNMAKISNCIIHEVLRDFMLDGDLDNMYYMFNTAVDIFSKYQLDYKMNSVQVFELNAFCTQFNQFEDSIKSGYFTIGDNDFYLLNEIKKSVDAFKKIFSSTESKKRKVDC